ncbi:MAG: translocation/assembly module TamB domain-containing protein, partial [Rubrivivax sp.]|nr:translocation/assembly module TamB domain-containing protein [Rubrivivax sp.]
MDQPPGPVASPAGVPVPAPTPAPAAAAGPVRVSSRHAQARPLRAGLYMLTPLVWVLLAAIGVAAVLAWAAHWLLFTEPGAAWLLARAPGVTEARGVRGALLGPSWQVERLRVQWDGGRQWLVLEGLQAEGLVWQWRPPATRPSDAAASTPTPGSPSPGPRLLAGLDMPRLHLRRLQVETGPPGPRPLPLPASLAAPLRLRLAELRVDELRVDALEPVLGLAVMGVVFDGSPGARHEVGQFATRTHGVQVQGQASLGNERPYPLLAQATLGPALLATTDAPPWAAVVRADGPLAAFGVQATLRGPPPAPTRGRAAAQAAQAGPALDLQAVVQPLEAWPVQQLTARTQGLDLAALHAAAPQTRIEGEVQLQAAARRAPVTAQLRLRNLLPGRWSERRVPVSQLELEARGELGRLDRLELSRFDLRLAGPATNDAAAAGAGRIEGRATWAAHQLLLEARLLDVRPQGLDLRAPAMVLTGPLRLVLEGLPSPDPRSTATPPPWGVSGQVALEGRAETLPRPVSVRAEGRANAAGLELQHLQVRSGDAQAVLRLTAQRQGQQEWALASEGSLAEFDPLPWWPGDESSAWRQGSHRLNAGWQFELRAPTDATRLAPLALLQRLAGNGLLRLHDSVLAGVPLAGEVTLRYGPGAGPAGAAQPAPPPAAAIGMLRADLQLGGNHLLVEGQGDPAGTGPGAGASDHWRAEVRAGNLATLAPLARLHTALAPWVPRGGTLQAQASAQGRWPAVASQGRLQLGDLQAGALAVERAEADWRIDLAAAGGGDEVPLGLRLEVSQLRLGEQRLADLRAEMRGTRADHRIEATATLPVAPGGAAATALNLAGRGGTRARLAAQGQWRAEAAGGGRWLARVDQLDLGPALAVSGAAQAPSAAGASPASAGASATPGSGALAGGPAALAERPAERPAGRPAERWAEARDLRAQLVFDAQGRLRSLSAEPGRLRLADTFTLRWEAVALDLRQPRADFAFSADIEPFALPPLLARLQPTLGWQGDLRLAAHVAVRAAERFEADLVFARVDGDLHVETQGELQLLGLTDFRLLAKVRDGLWDVEPVFRGRGLGEVRGRLRARTTPERRWPHDDAPLEGQVQVRVPDIGVWGHWLPPGWRLAGELSTTAQLSGRFAEPAYTGDLSGQGLAVRNLLQGVNVSDGRLRVRLAGASAQIESFTLRGGDGRVEVTGHADLGNRPAARLKINAERFRVLGRVDRQLTASGQAEVTLGTETSRVDGRFKVDEGLFDFTRADAPSLDEDVTVRGVEERDEAAAGRSGGNNRRQRLLLGVDVDLGEHLRAKGRGVDTGLAGQLRITNPGGRLEVRGRVESVQGTYAAYAQKLELERGIVAFEGPPDNPRLDIQAVRPNLDLRVGLLVSGPLQSLRVKLFSEPEMSETDKLSWLVLGRASDGLGRNDIALLQRAAIGLLAGEGEAPTDAFMRRLGIDELTLKQGDGEVRETVVSLGKQLSRRWYLGYERGVNATTGTWQLIYRAAQRF